MNLVQAGIQTGAGDKQILLFISHFSLLHQAPRESIGLLTIPVSVQSRGDCPVM